MGGNAFKILHVITTISRGGAESHLLELIKNQARDGARIAVAYLKGDGYWRTQLESLGVRVFALEMGAYGEIRPLLRLRSLIREFAPTLVHAHLPPAELYTRMALLGISRRRIPLVISKHNDEPFYKGSGQRVLGRWVARRADRVIAISEAVSRYMIDARGLQLPQSKVVTIHYGIVTTPYEIIQPVDAWALRVEWGVNSDELLFGTVARFVPQKALHILLEGFSLYLASATRLAKLALVGTGPLAGDLKQRAVDLGIEEHIVWAGFREDIPVVMNAMDVFSLTSVYEGFGLVLLEAMAAGKAVVASSVSAIPEIVLDRITGMLIPPGDTESLAAAFKVMEDDDCRHRMGLAGRERAINEFAVDRMAKETSRVYNCCLT